MTHLSSNASIGAMVLYSVLTFFIGPFITRPFMNDHPDRLYSWFFSWFYSKYIIMDEIWRNSYRPVFTVNRVRMRSAFIDKFGRNL